MFGMPEVRVGIPSVVEAALLPQLIGHGRARRLLLTGETIDADDGARLGSGRRRRAARGARCRGRALRGARSWPADRQALRLQKALIADWQDLPTSAAIAARHRRLRRAPTTPTSRAAWPARCSPKCGRGEADG